MRKIVSTLLVVGLACGLMGCPPKKKAPATSSAKTPSTSGKKTGTPAKAAPAKTDAKSTGIDVSDVKVGQKYTFDENQGAAKMQMVYEVKAVTPKAIKYAMSTIMNGKTVGPPNEVDFPLTAAKAPAGTKPAAAPAAKGEETITVSGVKFPCKIYENGGVKTWTSMKWPCTIKTMRGDKVTMVLTKIQ